MISASVVCLAMTLYFEARSESREARQAVADVVMNRSLVRFGAKDRLCQAVFEKGQFTWTSGRKKYDSQVRADLVGTTWFMGLYGIKEKGEWKAAVRDSLEFTRRDHRLLFFHSKKKEPLWARGLMFVKRVGTLTFYTSGDG